MMQSRSDKLLNSLGKIGEQRHFYALRGGFVFIMPIMIAGSFALLINNFPVMAYQNFMAAVFGENWRNFGVFIYNGTFQVVSLAICMSVAYCLCVWYRSNRDVDISPVQSAIIALCSFMVVSYPLEGGIPASLSGATGIFISIVVALASTEWLIFLKRKLESRLGYLANEPDRNIALSFTLLLPSIIVLCSFALVRLALSLLGLPPLHEAFYNLLKLPFGNLQYAPSTAVLFTVMTHVLWLFGIHGTNVLEGVAQEVFTTALNENMAAVAAGGAAPNIFTKTFFDTFVYIGGSGATICLVIALLLFTRRSGQKRLARISLFPGLFNINETLTYGLPVILNPVYALPFVLTPLALLITSGAAMALGLVPYTIADVTWTTPVFVSGYIATGGSWAAVALQAVNLVIGVLIYRPFVLFAQRLNERRFESAYLRLRKICEEEYTNSPGLRLLNRDDDVGAVARMLSMDLEDAIKTNQLYFLFQPLVNGESCIVSGAETLLRWQHPVYGHISPMVIVALAEDMGIIGKLDNLGVHAACKTLKYWNEQGLDDLYASVNISTTELKDLQFYDSIASALKTHGIAPKQLTVEVTEALALSDDHITMENLRKIHELGVGIAIDDFGMGHSSLVYLRRFPVTALKIDKSLSKDVMVAPENLEIIQSILQLCQTLGIGMIVEYVESQEQYETLLAVGCTHFQGYHFSRPIPADALVDYAKSLKLAEGGCTND